jgi:hypothetical protein
MLEKGLQNPTEKNMAKTAQAGRADSPLGVYLRKTSDNM